MKKTIKNLTILLLITCFSLPAAFAKSAMGDPIVIEVISKQTTIEDALTAAKNVLLANKFIATNGIQNNTFNATRTTGSKADYYVADVTASKDGEKIKLSITFVKIGSGLMSLKKVAEKVKKALEEE